MKLSGIADEAGSSIGAQIKAHKELGWDYLELRLVDGKNAARELPGVEFERAAAAIEDSGLRVSGFASAIGNWSRPITGDFSIDVQELKSAIPRMKRLGARYLRVMSWLGEGVSESEWHREAVRRCRELARIAGDAGIVLMHENCAGWGGLSARHMVGLLQEVDHPAFTLLYDVGNTISHGYDPQVFFDAIRHHFVYVHIKDAFRNPEGGRSQRYAYCGEGDALVEPIMEMVLNEDGFDGFLSIEPHVAAIVHLNNADAPEEEKFNSYIRYGEKWMELLKRIGRHEG